MITTAKQQGGNRQQETGSEAKKTHTNILLSLSLLRWEGERDDRVIVPLPLAVQEPSQPLYLRGEIHNNDLHLDIEMELENLRARLEGLCPRGDEHVPFNAELLECIDHLAELRAPGQYPELQKNPGSDAVTVEV